MAASFIPKIPGKDHYNISLLQADDTVSFVVTGKLDSLTVAPRLLVSSLPDKVQ
jgi:hypothetical protein